MNGKAISERRSVVGTIVDKEGALSIQVGATTWFPLEGNSGLAEDFENCVGKATPADIGKRVFRVFRVVESIEVEGR